MSGISSAGPQGTASICASLNSDADNGTKATLQTPVKVTSLSTVILDAMRADPNRKFLISDLVDLTGEKRNTITKTMSRLYESSKKGLTPIKKLSHGVYQYDLVKEQGSLQELARLGDWKLENLVFVIKGAQGGALSFSENDENTSNSDTRKTRPGYPQLLPSGQTVTWEIDPNGTQVIRLSANRAPPFSLDFVLYLIEKFQKEGLDIDKWECKSIELNIDSWKHRVDYCYELQIFRNALFKVYQHGYATRIEYADRRDIPLNETISTIMGMARSLTERITEKRLDDLEERVNRHNRVLGKRLPQGRKTSRNQEKAKREAKKQGAPVPGFMTAGEMKTAEARGGS